MTTVAISALVPRRRTTIRGRIVSVTPRVQPWLRLDVQLSDGTGSVILRFTGRPSIAGLTEGRDLRVEGTPGKQASGELVILNPVYSFISCADH
jgi:hypothetical protein